MEILCKLLQLLLGTVGNPDVQGCLGKAKPVIDDVVAAQEARATEATE